MYAKGTQTRESILLTAAHLFDKKGAYGTSIDDIARELGIAKGTLYQYFASKEDLIVKTILWSEGLLLERLGVIGEKGPTDVETAMFEIAKAFFGHFREYGDFIGLYLSVPAEITGEYRENGYPFSRLVGTFDDQLRNRCAGFSAELEPWELGTLAFMNLEAYRIEARGGGCDEKNFDADIRRRIRFFAYGIVERRD
jgi:AcrR family transcriptional regulator